MMLRHFLKVSDLAPEEIISTIDAAKANRGELTSALAGRNLGLIFSKPSTRTRVSFTVGMYHLGGDLMFLSESELQLGRGETIGDTARILSGYLDAVVIRTYSQEDLEDYAAVSEIPVINGLTDERHPCQALSDIMTISEFHDDLRRVKVVYLGDGNNVATSLMHVCALVGAEVIICSPEELSLPGWAIVEAKEISASTGARVATMTDPAEAVAG
ncbi:MAG: ornithine carbamoyltransferase, partial [Actinomycetota bacterium]